jgi:hypothetical protein
MLTKITLIMIVLLLLSTTISLTKAMIETTKVTGEAITTNDISSLQRRSNLQVDDPIRYCSPNPYISVTDCVRKQNYCARHGGVMSWVGAGCAKAPSPTPDGGCVCGKRSEYCHFHCKQACQRAKKWCSWDDSTNKCSLREPLTATSSPVIFNNPTCIKPYTPKPTKK